MILPVSLIRHYGRNADIYGYNTRQNSQLHKAHSSTVLMANSFLSKGVDLWNCLPTNLCNLSLRGSLQFIHEKILTLQLLIDLN